MLTRSASPFLQFLFDPASALEAPPLLLEVLPVAIYACDRDGRILWFNRKAVDLWGRTPHVGDHTELYCGSHKLTFDRRDIGRAETPMARVLKTGMAIHGAESAVERPDGTRVWVTVHIDPIHDADGNLLGAIGCFHDTTAAHEAQNALQQRQQDLEDFFENGAVALHLVGNDGTILRANQAELDLLGYRREEYVGRNIREFHADAPVVGDILSRLCAGQKLDKYPARLMAKDSSIRHVLITSNVQFRDGQFINTRCFTIDVTAAKLADLASREHDQRFAAAYEHAAIGVFEVDEEGRRLRVNEAACIITGRKREDLVGAVVFDTLHPEDRHEDLSQHRRLVAGEIDRYAIEKRYIRGDGRVAWLSVMCSAVRDASGKFLYAVRVFHDTTDTKHAIAALAENQQRLAATYEHAAIGISEVDEHGRLLRVNETVCTTIGYSAEELLKLTVFDVTHPDDRLNDRDAFQHQVGGDAGSYAVEKRLVCKDGRIIWVSVASSSVYDSEGRFLYGIRVMQDITARKHAEEMVRESEQRLRQLLEALPAAVYTTDAAGRVTFYNQAAVELSGREPRLGSDEWCVTWRLSYPDGTPMPHDQCPMAVALKENRPVRGLEAVAERPDGTRVPFIPYPTPLRDSRGALVGAVNMLVDITERKRAEDRQKALIDELNHRVKNTLATVQSLAAQTLHGSGVSAKVRDDFNARLFALSKTHDQLSRAGWESADFKSLVDGVLAPYQIQNAKQVRLGGPSVKLTPTAALLLAMVLHELATNAAKYGALSSSAGTLDLNWCVADGDAGSRLAIEWREIGGPPVQTPARRGFGSRLAERAISHELNGSAQIVFDPAGVHCQFEVPLVISPA